MDKIVLSGVPLMVRLGVPDDERADPQEVFADIELDFDVRPAARGDDFSQTIDYAAVHRVIQRAAQSRPYSLVETLAESITAAVLDGFGVAGVRVRIRKPGALRAQGVQWAGVEIFRSRGA